MVLYGILISAFAALFGYGGALWVRRRARLVGLMSRQGTTAPHAGRVPTGGGLGVVLGGSLVCVFVAAYAIWPAALVLAVSLAMAALGLREDIGELAWGWRLAAQALLVGVLVLLGIPLDAFQSATGLTGPLPLTYVLVVAGGIAWLNFFNFMEGVDGLAASETIYLLLAGAALALVSVPGVAELPTWWLLIGVAAATAGFLPLTWPPARIVIGDVGSTYAALMIAFLALVTIAANWVSLPQWLILAGLFIADPLVTLLRRLIQRDPIFEAHRRHAYQHLLRRWSSQRAVTLGALAVNLAVLLPLAAWAGAQPDLAWPIAGATYAVLAAFAIYAGAGAPDTDG